jgi:acetyl-CoA acetyltransferase
MSSYHGRTAIAGAGQTALSRRSGRSVLDQAREACVKALDSAGLDAREVDGIVMYSLYNDSVPAESVGTAIGAGDLTYAMDFAQGGQSASYMVMHAAMAIEAGLANNVLVLRALNGRSGVRVGRALAAGGSTEFRYPLGYIAYPQYTAMWARRWMIETGSTEEDLAAIAIAERSWAGMNDRAILRDPLTMDKYFDSPYVAAPYRVVDCTTEVDGAAAVLVTSLDRARDLQQTPAVITGSAWVTHGFDLDMGGALLYDDYSHNFANHLAGPLWKSAGLGPEDVDLAELYDCFTGVLAMNLEGLGLVGRGEAGNFAKEGHTSLGGKLPVNTNGGLLSEGYLHGMNTVTEAVWQMQGLCGERQVGKADVVAVCSGGLNSGSAMVLTKDR